MSINFRDKRDLIAFIFFTLIASLWVAGDFLISGFSWITGIFMQYEAGSFQTISGFLGIFFTFLILIIIQVTCLRFIYVSLRISSHIKLAVILVSLAIILPAIISWIISNNQYNLTLAGEHFAGSFRAIAKRFQFSAILLLLALPFFIVSAKRKKQEEAHPRSEEENIQAYKKRSVKIKKVFCLIIGFYVSLLFTVVPLDSSLWVILDLSKPYIILISLIKYAIIVGGSYIVLKHLIDKDSKIPLKSIALYVVIGVILGQIYGFWYMNALVSSI